MANVSQSELLDRTLATMEEDLQISRKQGKDFMDSLRVVVCNAIADGDAVTIGGMVKITPKYRPARKGVEVLKEFGNPEAGKIKKNFPASVKATATVLKVIKDNLPTPQKMARQSG